MNEKQFEQLMEKLERTDMKMNFLLGIFIKNNPFNMTREEMDNEMVSLADENKDIEKEIEEDNKIQMKNLFAKITSNNILDEIFSKGEEYVASEEEKEFILDNHFNFQCEVYNYFEKLDEIDAPEYNEDLMTWYKATFDKDYVHVDEIEMFDYDENEEDNMVDGMKAEEV